MANQIPENDQLKGITIIIDSIEWADDEDETPYSSTMVYRGDLEGPISEFIKRIEVDPQIVEFNRMKDSLN